MSLIPSAFLDDLTAVAGAGNIRVGDRVSELDPGIDPRNLDTGVVVTPVSVEAVADVVRLCAEAGISIVPHGGRTGLSGGAVSSVGQIVLGTSRLTEIVSIDPIGGTITVEAGVTLGAVHRAAAEYGLSVGIDMASRDSATVGGMVSTNAGGIEAFRHGVMRRRVLGLEAVMPDGSLFSEMKRVGKANEGYDIKQLLIGAEGTLGVITKVVLDLVPQVENRATALVTCDTPDGAARLFGRFRNSRAGELLAAEIMWPDYARTVAAEIGKAQVLDFHPDPDSLFVLFEVADDGQGDGQEFLELVLAEALEEGEATNGVVAKNEAERADFWLIREESFVIDRKSPHGFWYDVSIPLAGLASYADRLFPKVTAVDPRLRTYMMGHLGDGNMHLTISAGVEMPADCEAEVSAAVYEGLAACGGSFSAEHGIGLEKRSALSNHGVMGKAALMQTVKQALDPQGIMNPGKVL